MSNTTPQAKPTWAQLPQHYATLDGVRGLAILWVILHNTSVAEESILNNLQGKLLVAFLDSGWAAVTLFFSLSGFLITGILLDYQKNHRYRDFYVRRTLRIFPLYYAVLFGAFFILPHLSAELPRRLVLDQPQQWWLWLYVSNWASPLGMAGHVFPHFWSLAVEEQFYLVWPLLIGQRSPRTILRISIMLIAIAQAFRIALYLYHAPDDASYMFTLSRMDALVMGGAAAALLRIPAWSATLVARAPSLLAFSALSFLALFAEERGLSPHSSDTILFGHLTLGISFTALILGLATFDMSGKSGWWIDLWRSKLLGVLAKYSYGMYVFHKIIGDAVGRPFMRAHPAWLSSIPAQLIYGTASILLSLGAAFLSFHLLEKHFLSLKNKLSG